MTQFTQEIQIHLLGNGLTLIVESMPWLESAAFALSMPSGCQYDPAERIGTANLTSEMVERGCGTRTSREYVEALERLGTDISSSVSVTHTSFGASMPKDSMVPALEILADLVRRPGLPRDQFQDAKQVCLQEIRALDDDLGQKTMRELRRRRYGDPFGRSNSGTEESLARIEYDDVQACFENHYQPGGTILAVAGNVDFGRLKDSAESLFGDWEEKPRPQIVETPPPLGNFHIQHDSNQTHIGLAYPGVPYSDENYFRARGSVGVLSDGMSSRLFTEVREKRGLCYTVFASMHSLKDRGSIIVYAGTSSDRAQETLDVTVDELTRLQDGITEQELDRLKVGIRSSLVMQQESSRSRAASIAGDYYHLGKVRTLEELNGIINALTVEEINQYLKDNPPRDFNLVTLGPTALEEPRGISPTSA